MKQTIKYIPEGINLEGIIQPLLEKGYKIISITAEHVGTGSEYSIMRGGFIIVLEEEFISKLL